MVLEEKTDLAPKQELFGYNFVKKTQVENGSKIDNVDVKRDSGLLEDPNVRDENIASFDEKTKKFLCTKCDASFTRKGMVKYHFAKVHKENNKRSIRCKFCSCRILSQTDLDLHILSVHGGKMPECTICNESFNQESHLVIHLKEVHDEKMSYSCHICGTKCSKKQYLKLHIESVHEKKKPFKCNFCDYSSSALASLNGHTSKNHGAALEERKKFPCPICKKNHVLIAHIIS